MPLKPFVILVGFLLLFRTNGSGQDVVLPLDSFQKEFSNDAAATMKKVKDLGFSQIQMDQTYGLSFPQFIKLLAVNGLSVISFETTLEKLNQSPQAVVDEARAYGARYIVCNSASGKTFSKEQGDAIANTLNQAGKTVAQSGLLLCYHAGGSDFTTANGTNYFDYLIQRIDKGTVYLAMDVCAIKKSGTDPVAVLKKYPTRFVLIYLQDKKLTTGPDNSNVALGRGDVGILEIMRTARELGIQYFLLEDNSPQAEQHLSEGLAYLKGINDQSRK